MRTTVRVLSDDDLAAVHERTFSILETTGVRVDSEIARGILAEAGARVDEATRVVRFPRALVERSLALAPRHFTLGGRRAGWSVAMNEDRCSLVGDGETVHVVDRATGLRRPGTHADWVEVTRLLDAADEVGVYWRMIEAGRADRSPAGAVRHWATPSAASRSTSRTAPPIGRARWLLEVLDVVFGVVAVRRSHPLSFLVCPVSPLVLEALHRWLPRDRRLGHPGRGHADADHGPDRAGRALDDARHSRGAGDIFVQAAAPAPVHLRPASR
jgi:trimethylamine--corrinoid protein Co-methyltransferase